MTERAEVPTLGLVTDGKTTTAGAAGCPLCGAPYVHHQTDSNNVPLYIGSRHAGFDEGLRTFRGRCVNGCSVYARAGKLASEWAKR